MLIAGAVPAMASLLPLYRYPAVTWITLHLSSMRRLFAR